MYIERDESDFFAVGIKRRCFKKSPSLSHNREGEREKYFEWKLFCKWFGKILGNFLLFSSVRFVPCDCIFQTCWYQFFSLGCVLYNKLLFSIFWNLCSDSNARLSLSISVSLSITMFLSSLIVTLYFCIPIVVVLNVKLSNCCCLFYKKARKTIKPQTLVFCCRDCYCL